MKKYNFDISIMGKQINMDSFQKYLDNLEKPPVNLSGDFADYVRKFWKNICTLTKNKVKLPIAGPMEDEEGKGFGFEWQKDNKVITINIYKNKTFHWFFRDRETNISYGSEAICFGIPLDFILLLEDFGS